VWDRLQSRRDTKIEAWWKISGLKHYIKEREDAVSIEGGKTMSYIKLIPENTKYSLDAYANKEHPTGGFLQAVLENNLMEAVARADDFNVRALKEICMYIYNELPSQCHGSKEKVAAWVRSMYEDDKRFQTMGVSDDK
jgi:sulfatase maturation enzyme AslB (radical SAM superfamily)